MRKVYVVRLTDEERGQLEGIVRKFKVTSQKVRRAQILLKADADVTARLSADQLTELFDLGYHMKHVDTIFDRVFKAA